VAGLADVVRVFPEQRESLGVEIDELGMARGTLFDTAYALLS